jgi:hypothetical protein
MKLRTGIPLYLGAILLTMLFVIFVTIVVFAFEQSETIEKESMTKDIERVINSIVNEENSLHTVAGDYAAWDDTYQFVQDKNEEYVSSNFASDSFKNLHVNLVAVLDEQWNVVYARAYDWKKNANLDLPADLSKFLRSHLHTCVIKEPTDRCSDYIRLNDIPMFLAARPIVTSELQGPIKGTLIMMRNLDSHYVESLSKLTRQKISLITDVSPQNIDAIFAPSKLLAPGVQRVINFVDNHQMEAFFTTVDDEGNVQAVFRLERNRTVNGFVLETLKRLAVFFLFFSLILVTSSLLVVDKLILRRLSRLSKSVLHYDTDASLLSRIMGKRNDELTSLAKSIQAAFRELDVSRKKIKAHADKTDLERKKLHAILQSIAEGVFVVDRHGKIVLANAMTRMLAGTTHDELLNSPFYKHLKFLNEDKNPVAMDFLQPVLKKSTVVKTEQNVIFVPKKGDPIHVSLAAAPIKKRSEVVGSVVVFEDKSKEYEVDKMKSEFVSIASHQLRTPLTGIKWMISLLLQGQAGKLNRKQLEFLQNIDSSNERMIQLVNDLLNVSRIESSTAQKLEKTDCDLKNLIGEVMNEQRSIAKQTDIRVEMETSPAATAAVVAGDRDKLYQVMMNLVNNAIKYSKKGGSVRLGYAVEGSFIKIFVQDSGIGIPKAQQSKIFQKFFRADNAIQNVATGTGLGLYYVKTVVEAHGGRIWFDSEQGKGTTFYLTLPLLKK